jgi:hypothetical protein
MMPASITLIALTVTHVRRMVGTASLSSLVSRELSSVNLAALLLATLQPVKAVDLTRQVALC